MSTPSSPTVIRWEVNFDSHQPIPPFWLLLFQSRILSDLQDPPSAMSVSRPWPTMPMLQFSCRNRPTGSQAAVGFRLDLGRSLLAETSKLWESCQKRLVSPLLGIASVTEGRARGTDKCPGSRAEEVTESTEETFPVTLFQRGMWSEKKSIVRDNLYRRKRSTGGPEPCCSLPCRLAFILVVRTQGSCKQQLSLVLTSNSGNFSLITSTVLIFIGLRELACSSKASEKG